MISWDDINHGPATAVFAELLGKPKPDQIYFILNPDVIFGALKEEQPSEFHSLLKPRFAS